MEAELLDVQDLCDDVKHFVFSKPEGFTYKPGQFLNVFIPDTGEKPEKRAYSLASAPHEETLDLCVKIVPNGLGSTYLFNLKKGDKIEFKGPHGHLCPKDDAEEFVYIAVSTGIAPFLGHINHLLKEGSTKPITVLMGARFKNQLLYDEKFKELAKHDHITYHRVLSRDDDEGAHKGHVQAVLSSEVLDENSAKRHYYLCGMPEMVNECTRLIKEKGVEPKQIKFEAY